MIKNELVIWLKGLKKHVLCAAFFSLWGSLNKNVCCRIDQYVLVSQTRVLDFLGTTGLQKEYAIQSMIGYKLMYFYKDRLYKRCTVLSQAISKCLKEKIDNAPLHQFCLWETYWSVFTNLLTTSEDEFYKTMVPTVTCEKNVWLFALDMHLTKA